MTKKLANKECLPDDGQPSPSPDGDSLSQCPPPAPDIQDLELSTTSQRGKEMQMEQEPEPGEAVLSSANAIHPKKKVLGSTMPIMQLMCHQNPQAKGSAGKKQEEVLMWPKKKLELHGTQYEFEPDTVVVEHPTYCNTFQTMNNTPVCKSLMGDYEQHSKKSNQFRQRPKCYDRTAMTACIKHHTAASKSNLSSAANDVKRNLKQKRKQKSTHFVKSNASTKTDNVPVAQMECIHGNKKYHMEILQEGNIKISRSRETCPKCLTIREKHQKIAKRRMYQNSKGNELIQ